MTANFLSRIGLAAFLCLAPALLPISAAAEDAPAAEADPLDTTAPAAQDDAPRYAVPPVCGIAGTVAEVRNVTRSPWSDSTPAAFALTEVQVTVMVEKRFARGSTPAGACPDATGEGVTYKLCSPTPVTAGNVIRATEGMAPVGGDAAPCLFDVAVETAE